jgi:hypothetical protein
MREEVFLGGVDLRWRWCGEEVRWRGRGRETGGAALLRQRGHLEICSEARSRRR